MDWGGPTFVILIVAICTGGWLVNNWIRARHGYPLEDEWGGKTERGDTQEVKKLKEENAALHGQLDKMTDRLVNLEKIVTDRGYSLSEEIEALRDRQSTRDSGVPLDAGRREKV